MAVLLLVTVLVGLVIALAEAQRGSTDELRARFADRARTGAGVVEGTLISFAPQQAALAERFLSGDANRGDLRQAVDGEAAAALYGPDGELITRIGNDGVGDDPAKGGDAQYVADARRTGVGVSNLLDSAAPDLAGVIRQAVRFVGKDGTRVLVTSFDAALAQAFVGQSLEDVATLPGEQLAIVDPNGALIAGATALTVEQLAALQPGSGTVQSDGGIYYVKVPIPGLSLSMVSTAPESTVVEPLSGSRTVQWLLLAALALISLIVIYLLVRVAADASRLEQRRREAEEANRAKSQFLASMSHELRTPLNGIIGFTELMHDGKVGDVSPEHKEYLGDVLVSARHLLGLINEVLDLSRIESGRTELEPEMLSPGALIGDTIEAMRPLANEREIEVAAQGLNSVPEVRIDPVRLRQILFNFLSNALKFTPPGGSVMLRLEPLPRDRFRIEVEDTGIGIDAGDQARIFDDFEQAEAPLTPADQSTGLGLSVTRRLVEEMGGAVGLVSSPGAGSTFWVELPAGGAVAAEVST